MSRNAGAGSIIASTPTKRWVVLVIAAALFITAPLVVAYYFAVELQLGVYPTDADSIAIPIGNFVIFWFVTAPLVWTIIRVCVRRYPGRVSLMAWDAEQPLRSIVWSLFFGLSIAVFLAMAPWPIAQHHPTFIAHTLADVWLMLVLRSAVVAQRRLVPCEGAGP